MSSSTPCYKSGNSCVRKEPDVTIQSCSKSTKSCEESCRLLSTFVVFANKSYLKHNNHTIHQEFPLILVFKRTKKYKPCGVILDSYNKHNQGRCIYQCTRRDDCIRVISSQQDQTCHLIGHPYIAGNKVCLGLSMTQWMRL